MYKWLGESDCRRGECHFMQWPNAARYQEHTPTKRAKHQDHQKTGSAQKTESKSKYRLYRVIWEASGQRDLGLSALRRSRENTTYSPNPDHVLILITTSYPTASCMAINFVFHDAPWILNWGIIPWFAFAIHLAVVTGVYRTEQIAKYLTLWLMIKIHHPAQHMNSSVCPWSNFHSTNKWTFDVIINWTWHDDNRKFQNSDST